jgi:sugar/nucleoside kinase (ribokinase family)
MMVSDDQDSHMTNTRNKPIVCLGIIVADVVGRPLRALPDRGRLVLVDEMELHTGGCAVNTATALARLGLPVEVIDRNGTDPFGDYVLRQLHQRGIGARGVSLPVSSSHTLSSGPMYAQGCSVLTTVAI